MIEKVLRPLLRDNHKIDYLNLNNVTSNLVGATSSDIVFYRLHSGETNKQMFIDRLKNADPGCVVLLGDFQGENIINVEKDDFEKLQRDICNIVFPQREISLLGVTGTNGKTSTVHFASQILWQQKISNATLGTMGLLYRDKCIYDFQMTTPGYIELRKAISLLPLDVEHLVLEVSSHGLAQRRLGDLTLSRCGWTNFTQDHLDFHKTMDDYFKAKSKIIDYSKDNVVLIPHNESLEKMMVDHHINFKKVKAFENLKLSNLNPYFEIKYHRENFELAFDLVSDLIDHNAEIDMNHISYPEGRFEIIDIKDRMVIVDYAHTPDALEKLLTQVKKVFTNKKIHLVFGCGGDRDQGKRPIMGKIASNYADVIYLTDDNPRFENSDDILDMIADGVEKQYIKINDRKSAIEKSIAQSQPGDIIIIAGKGHEKYQDIKGHKAYFSDQDIVKSLA